MFQFLLPLIFTIPVTAQSLPAPAPVPQTQTIIRTIYRTLPSNKVNRVQQAVDNGYLLPTVTRLSKRTLTSITQAMQSQEAAISRFPHGRSFLSQDNTYVQKALRFSFRYPRTWMVAQSLEPLARPYGGTAVWAVTVAPEKNPFAASALPLPIQPISDAPMPFVAQSTSPGTISLVIEEVPLRVAAPKTERDPVAERLASLLLDPVAPPPGHSRPLYCRAVGQQTRPPLARTGRAAAASGVFARPESALADYGHAQGIE